MTNPKTPGIYFNENVESELIVAGAKIPVIIGKTGNTATENYPVDGSAFLKFSKYADANRTIANGGIGTDTSTNPLLAFLKDFFEEATVTASDQLGVPYVYVIDVGAGTDKTAWTTAFTTAKRLNDATVEAYVGADNITDYTLSAFIAGAAASIASETRNLNLRTGFVTKTGATDAQLIALNPTSGGILNSRMFLLEPLLFGKTVARFCTTPYYVEPGFLPYRTVEPGTFIKRTEAEVEALQEAGVVVNVDEGVYSDIYCRINLSVSTAYAKNPRPADATGHARFNADHLLREIFKALYPQIKDNEVQSNIVKRQSIVNAIIDEEIEAKRIKPYDSTTGKGTKLTLVEAENPYDMELNGQILPVNCTKAILVNAQLQLPN